MIPYVFIRFGLFFVKSGSLAFRIDEFDPSNKGVDYVFDLEERQAAKGYGVRKGVLPSRILRVFQRLAFGMLGIALFA